jgi:hypothetical protein
VSSGRAAQGAAPFGAFGLEQVALAHAGTQYFAAGGYFEALRHGLFGFNAFGPSHKSIYSLSKRARNIESPNWRSK